MRTLIALAVALAICGLPAFGKPTPESLSSKPKPTTANNAPRQQKTKSLADTIWDYSRTTGTAAMSYAAAKAEPELMSKLFCYCGCDVADKMTSLLTCYQSDHSVSCYICQEEAMLAIKLKKQGLSTGDIQKEMDRHFSYLYPFSRDSEILKRYKATREYKAGS